MHIKLTTGEYLMMAQVEMIKATGQVVCIKMASGTLHLIPMDSEEKAQGMVEMLMSKMAYRLGVGPG